MPITSHIRCDRCDDTATSGLAVTVNRIVFGDLGEPLNINLFGDTPQYAVCDDCVAELRAFLGGEE